MADKSKIMARYTVEDPEADAAIVASYQRYRQKIAELEAQRNDLERRIVKRVQPGRGRKGASRAHISRLLGLSETSVRWIINQHPPKL